MSADCLVDAAWVEARLGDPGVVVVDVEAEAGYARGHIPGAVLLQRDYERDPDIGWVQTLPAERFGEVCRGLGIGDDTTVVVYDNDTSLQATRLWWVLNYYGHTNTRVLDGGWRRWVQEQRPISFSPPVIDTDVTFTPKADPSIVGQLDEIKSACGRTDAVIWDVRTGGEFDGTVNRGNKRAGHIAGAVHLEWSDLMDHETHLFKAPEEMRRILADKGVTPDKAVFAY